MCCSGLCNFWSPFQPPSHSQLWLLSSSDKKELHFLLFLADFMTTLQFFPPSAYSSYLKLLFSNNLYCPHIQTYLETHFFYKNNAICQPIMTLCNVSERNLLYANFCCFMPRCSFHIIANIHRNHLSNLGFQLSWLGCHWDGAFHRVFIMINWWVQSDRVSSCISLS